ncbi:ABC transporter ATP-binding protein [Verminephrobacter aporrectodeae]|uniref:ABC transporter ATP-binding protein n=1 Tax=Verminephrobacter aporrectodeae subsp. tuberculatae TaxID=1110392 RepID=A0ABT3KUI8_9BURK|nr:ABC transporter ATP-binding protein [Verminephrobacter aporrectodeae]MCW5222545.1 ABC transporter ATP-binding protein [Verminephrobacter aporrectodeae subsp. tuberculatae]MCW5257245.1 ABC transporter ATP-binding protein [Verminephrobacter aporrectodeae subsp. tuberculatae]MCW5288010.1 ABC transporter ATP-binding protein [Verminephrobacter aporrectodeae subsp. tuberculatae]MCW5321574.1 ABC transporter ATP-binding protein [Verminephrobacter aporrectodeae subsp. tuberculatae]MCW8174985.1 ABC t
MSALLEIDAIDTAYGSSQVLRGLSLRVEEGSVHSIAGRNGVGKTTLLRSLLGLTPPRRGSVHFRGRRIDGRSPSEIARMGIALVPEGRQIFPNLTVTENLVAFAANRHGAPAPWTLERVHGLFPRLAERGANLGHQLSGGEQQMLAIGRALMTNPYLLILDEATEGLAPLIRRDIWQCLAMLHRTGLSILVIDKYVAQLIRLADRHSIVERGQVVWEGDSQALDADRSLWRRYLSV